MMDSEHTISVKSKLTYSTYIVALSLLVSQSREVRQHELTLSWQLESTTILHQYKMMDNTRVLCMYVRTYARVVTGDVTSNSSSKTRGAAALRTRITSST